MTSPLPPPVGPAPMILVAEDNLINSKIISRFLTRLALPHLLVPNGHEALTLYTTSPSLRTSLRCILMDISMPVMDGMEATRRIREFEKRNALPRVRIVALSAQYHLRSGSEKLRSLGAGADEVMGKPVSLRELRRVLGREVEEVVVRREREEWGLVPGGREGAVRRLGMVRGHFGGVGGGGGGGLGGG